MSGILTEEELKRIEDALQQLTQNATTKAWISEIINSHHSLLSANAELSFKNNEQRKTIDHQHILLDKYESMLNGGSQ